MIDNLIDNIGWLESQIKRKQPIEKIGRVVQVTGLIIESLGPDAALGDICEIHSSRGDAVLSAEVVGFRDNHILLMALGNMTNLHPGCRVFATNQYQHVPIGQGLVGRIIDGMGRPLDNKGPLHAEWADDLYQDAPNPLKRKKINQTFATGVRVIDTFVPLGCGQRRAFLPVVESESPRCWV